ncbi:putative phloem protein [Helianthus debilis subsp. tardiflorus]
MGSYHYKNGSVKTHVKTQFLTPMITYVVNLVFKFTLSKATKSHEHISIKYKLQGETKTSTSYLACERDEDDGWWMCELYQFASDHRVVVLEILFDSFNGSYTYIEVEGIEFRPLEKEDEKLDMQSISDSDANWEAKLPTDYGDIITWSKNHMQWTTKKEAYSILCRGFLINDGNEWFSCDKNGKKCHMLSARLTCIHGRRYPYWLSVPESRFGEALQLAVWRLSIKGKIQSKLVSSETTYATYLVYKLPKDESMFKAPLKVNDIEHLGSDWYIYLVSPQTPVIRPKVDQNTHNPLSRPKIKGLPQQRNDGWMEVQIWEFHIQNAITTKNMLINLHLTHCGDNIPLGLIIQGIEFRPI